MMIKPYSIQKSTTIKLLNRHRELFIWIAALVMLYTADLHTDFTLCIPSHLGFENCPGCGLGHSITSAMHGNFALSWEYHYFGMAALAILFWHIVKLTKKLITDIKNNNYYG